MSRAATLLEREHAAGPDLGPLAHALCRLLLSSYDAMEKAARCEDRAAVDPAGETQSPAVGGRRDAGREHSLT